MADPRKHLHRASSETNDSFPMSVFPSLYFLCWTPPPLSLSEEARKTNSSAFTSAVWKGDYKWPWRLPQQNIPHSIWQRYSSSARASFLVFQGNENRSGLSIKRKKKLNENLWGLNDQIALSGCGCSQRTKVLLEFHRGRRVVSENLRVREFHFLFASI